VQAISQEGNEDVGLDARLELVKDRSDRQIAFEVLECLLDRRHAEPKPKQSAVNKPARESCPRRYLRTLLPVFGGGRKTDAAVAEPAGSTAPKRRKKAG
jgi:hypothetical protein